MVKSIESHLVPDQYGINEADGVKFIFAQPNGEKIIVHEKPSMAKTVTVAIAAGAALVGGWAYWVASVPR